MASVDPAAGGLQQPVLIYDRIASNKRRTWLLMFLFVLLLGCMITAMAWLWATWSRRSCAAVRATT